MQRFFWHANVDTTADSSATGYGPTFNVTDSTQLLARFKSFTAGCHSVLARVVTPNQAGAERSFAVCASEYPALSLSPTTHSFNALLGATDPASGTVSVTNSGGGTLSGLSIGTINQSWLGASINQSTAPATVTISPSISGLAVGTYNGTVPVLSSLDTVFNEPANIGVALQVWSAPIDFVVSGECVIDGSTGSFNVTWQNQASGSGYEWEIYGNSVKFLGTATLRGWGLVNTNTAFVGSVSASSPNLYLWIRTRNTVTGVTSGWAPIVPAPLKWSDCIA
jgi:hypothetical protein